MFVLLLFAAFCAMTPTIAYSQQLQLDEINRVDEIIDEYARNEAKAGKYCVTIKVDLAVIAHKAPVKSRNAVSWQTFAFDAHQKARRYDEIKELHDELGLPIPQ